MLHHKVNMAAVEDCVQWHIITICHILYSPAPHYRQHHSIKHSQNAFTQPQNSRISDLQMYSNLIFAWFGSIQPPVSSVQQEGLTYCILLMMTAWWKAVVALVSLSLTAAERVNWQKLIDIRILNAVSICHNCQLLH